MEIDVTITLLASNVVNGVVIFGRNGTFNEEKIHSIDGLEVQKL